MIRLDMKKQWGVLEVCRGKESGVDDDYFLQEFDTEEEAIGAKEGRANGLRQFANAFGIPPYIHTISLVKRSDLGGYWQSETESVKVGDWDIDEYSIHYRNQPYRGVWFQMDEKFDGFSDAMKYVAKHRKTFPDCIWRIVRKNGMIAEEIPMFNESLKQEEST